MEKIIDVTAARRQFGTLLDEVFYKKESIIIQRKGKSLAKIIPLEIINSQDNKNTTISLKQRALLEEMEGLPVILSTENPTSILRSIREENRIKTNKKYAK
ncbi:MAG: type II toxin-antitoxin system prevent-host-death family antitoxin [Spirochaetota bacterium]|nr:type II toxin-antitoxin system prevent-host-death family antitoxin [Spirochaetota bacterium]